MSRISNILSALNANGKKALIPYITAGDPDKAFTVEIMNTLVSAGADIIELGIPFSDPMADGPVIQLACERALANHTSLSDVLNMVAEFRRENADTPVVLMGYLNPVERMGYEVFIEKARAAGVDGLLIVDLPPEESEAFNQLLKANEMDSIYLIAPTTSDARIKQICDASSGYVYYVSVKGVTGSAALDTHSVAEKVGQIKSMASIPVGVGFGIRDAEAARAVSQISDGVIVGSVLVNIIADNQGSLETINEKLASLVGEMRREMDRV